MIGLKFCVASALSVQTGLAQNGMCSWCEAGTCDSVCNVNRVQMVTSISAAIGKTAPYWVPADADVQSLQSPFSHSNVELAALMHHGAARNGDDYLCSMFNSVKKNFGEEFARQKAVVFAPQMSLRQEAQDGELYWDDTGSSSWAWGGNSTSSFSMSIASFQVLDEMLLELTNSTRFPRLRRVVVAGHSAGGQVLVRYAMSNKVHDKLLAAGLSVEYFPANPSSYTYLDNRRPVLPADVSCASLCNNVSIAAKTYEFSESPSGGSTDCADYNTYGYGLDGESTPYVQSVGNDTLRANFRERTVTYLSGSSDICNQPWQTDHVCEDCTLDDGGLDVSCEAYAQGWCRMERAHAFLQHVRMHYNEPGLHSLVAVPDVGHNGCAMVQSAEARAAMFPGAVLV